MIELDDLLNEMLAESEAALNGQSTIQQTNSSSNNNNSSNSNGGGSNLKISFQEQMPNGNGTTTSVASSTSTTQPNPNTEKRKSRLSQHPNNLNEGGFDYLDTLLNDMSDESIRNSIKPDNSRIKSLRLTTTFDLESTLKDLEETFMKDSTVQNKRKPSQYLSKNLSPPPVSSNINNNNNNTSPSPLPSPSAETQNTNNNNNTHNDKLPPHVSISEEQPQPQQQQQQQPQPPPVLKRISSERAIILTKEAIDAADLLDEMIESFGGIPEPSNNSANNNNNQAKKEITTSAIPTPIVTPLPTPTNNTTTNNNNNNNNRNTIILNTNKSPNGTLPRPASKLGAPVDIQVSSPKAPTPIPTLSSPQSAPVSPSFKDSDKLLDDMISHFKDSNSNLLTSSSNIDPNAPKVVYVSQQHYTLSVEEQQLSAKVKVQNVADEDVVQKILGDNDIDDVSNAQSKHNHSTLLEQQQSEKSWYIKPQPSDTIGFGNNGITQRSGVHKDKRIVMKTWNFIQSQATPMLFNEIEQLVAIKHPNILPLVGASFDNNFVTFSEYITGSNLDIVIKNLDEKNELQLIIRLSEEIATAMAFLHSFNIVHRSLHPKNILLNSDLKIYIKDFGFTSLKDETLKKKLSTKSLSNQLLYSQYLAPELFNVLSGSKGGYDTKVDVFSFGVLLWEMFARDTKLSDLKGNTINGYTHYLRPPLPNCPFTIEKLIKLCLSTDPNVRPTFTTILKVLRQPLHTIQRYTKPVVQQEQEQQQGQQQQQESEIDQKSIDEKIKNELKNSGTSIGSGSNSGYRQLYGIDESSLDPEKRIKIQKISNVVKDLIGQPTLLNLHRASTTIDSLVKNTENIDYCLDAEFVPLIFQLIDQPYHEIQLSCLKQFSILIEHNQEVANVFRNLLGITILKDTLSNNNENILFATLRLISQLSNVNISSSNVNNEGDDTASVNSTTCGEENREQILNKGIIPNLINLLLHENELIKLQVLWCLSMLFESNNIQMEFVKLGGVDQLIDMMVHSMNSGFDLRCASALSRLISLKTVQDQINNGHYRERMLKKYLSLLSDTNFEALRMLGLEAIACLVSNKDNQSILIHSDIISLLNEYLDPMSTSIAPQMTALKIILMLSVNPSNSSYLKSSNISITQLKHLQSSPHPSIQKAVEKILFLISN